MAGSLQDQLLKAGLVSKKQVDRAEKDKHQNRHGGKTKRKPKANRTQDITLQQAYAQRANKERSEKDRELNRKREEARLRKELNQRLQQVIQPNSLNDPKGEVSRFFEWSGKIRKVYLNTAQHAQVSSGALGIAHLKGRFHVVNAEVIAKIKDIKSEAVAYFAPDLPDDPAEDDIPDDLIW